MSGMWRWYLKVLEKYPWRTMSISTGALMMAGDGISQMAIEKRGLKNYDTVRGARFLFFGCVVMGPTLRGWYFALDRVFKGTAAAPIKMVVFDQGCFAPTILMVFLTGMGLLKGDSVPEIKDKVEKDYGTILLTNYKIWPAAQLINFYLVPVQHRVMFVNFIALGWNTYLAWMSQK